jgi:hypothetical protein
MSMRANLRHGKTGDLTTYEIKCPIEATKSLTGIPCLQHGRTMTVVAGPSSKCYNCGYEESQSFDAKAHSYEN